MFPKVLPWSPGEIFNIDLGLVQDGSWTPPSKWNELIGSDSTVVYITGNTCHEIVRLLSLDVKQQTLSGAVAQIYIPRITQEMINDLLPSVAGRTLFDLHFLQKERIQISWLESSEVDQQTSKMSSVSSV